MKKDVYDLVRVQERKGFYPLSCTQKEIYNSNDKTIIQNITIGILFNFKLVPSKVQNALNKLVELNSSFRTRFTYTDNTLVQSILENVEINIDIEHSSLDVQTLVDNFATPFDLANPPLLHAKLVFLDDGSSLLLLDSHRIIVDEISLSVIFHNFYNLYNGKDIDICDLEYIDYATWENTFFSSDRVISYENFWVNQIKNYDSCFLDLPQISPNSNFNLYKKEEISLNLSNECFNGIENIARKNNVSNYSVFLACLYILFYKYTCAQNITISSPLSGRFAKELENIIGNFSRITPLNININENETFENFIKAVENNIQNSIFNSPYYYDFLNDKINLEESKGLSDIMFLYKDLETNLPNAEKFLSKNVNFYNAHLCFKFDVSKNALILEFNNEVIKLHSAQSLISHFFFILKQALNNEKIKISNFDIVTQEETRVLERLNEGSLEENNEMVLSVLSADKKFYKLDTSGKWIFDTSIKLTEKSSLKKSKPSFKPSKDKSYDFLSSYDYSKVNNVLARNTAKNFDTISKTNVGNILLIRWNWLSWCSYCI